MNAKTYDVAIIGGGIGGSILAAILARQGVSTVILEGSPHPRFAIGESTIPETTLLLRCLAARYDVPELGLLSSYGLVRRHVVGTCGIKRNFSFVYHRPGRPADPGEQVQLATFGAPIGPDIHFFRQDVDSFLYQTAIRYGARAMTARVAEVEFGATSVRLETSDGQDITARYVVDAGGREALIPKKLGLRDKEPRFKTRSKSIFTHMVGVRPWDSVGPPRKAHGLPSPLVQGTLHHLFDGGWMWVIPFNNHPGSSNLLCSVGVNFDARPGRARYQSALPAEDQFWEFLREYPSLKDQFSRARAVRPFMMAGPTQFSSKQMAGDRFFLLPHAAEFVDPLFSSGLSITASAINALAHRIITAVADDDFSTERFSYVEEWARKSFDAFDDLVSAAYTCFADFRLWNAMYRLWVLSGTYSGVNVIDTWLGYHGTKDPKVFERLEAAPRRGTQSVDLPEMQDLTRAILAEVDRYGDGTQGVDATAAAIYRHIAASPLNPAPFRMADESAQCPTGSFTVPRAMRLFAWLQRSAPACVRGEYMKYAAPAFSAELLRLFAHDIKSFSGSSWEIVRDMGTHWNREWTSSAVPGTDGAPARVHAGGPPGMDGQAG
jgi:tetracycline 7-halogenase / FADH2 O2-dependent halogenase